MNLYLVILFWFMKNFTSVNLTSKPSQIIRLFDGGPVVGRQVVSFTGKIVTEFLGIPFAEPPIGEFRFRPPVPKKPWASVYKAHALSRSCYQEHDVVFPGFQGAEMWNPNTVMDEDCLYLNVWVPGIVDPGKKLTVMVWIYGGGFVTGSSTLDVYDSKIFSTEENVIIVSMNYRVTLFGFLYTGGPEAPGNVGLLDQLEALKWVNRNIGLFGGNPEDVTIFGESAGAASVSLHALSPMSQPYFNRYILQSGSPTNPFTIIDNEVIVDHLLEVYTRANCSLFKPRFQKDLASVVAYLKTCPPDELIKHQWTTSEFLDFPWRPVLDYHFLIEHPRASVNNGNFKSGQVLLGSNLHEANFFIVYHCSIYQSNETDYKKKALFTKQDLVTTDGAFDQCASELLPKVFEKSPVLKKAILFEYKDWELPGDAVRRQDALDKLIGDYMFTCNVNEFAQKSDHFNNSVYYYYFTHRSSQQTWPVWMGALHGYEINFIFGEPLNTEKHNYTHEERELSRKFMRYWANFARTGNPNINPDNSWTADQWPQYGKNQQYLTLTVNSSKIGASLRRRQCAFWKTYLPKLKISTAGISETEVRWKHQFTKWHDEYFSEWQYQLEKYQRLQQYTYL